MSNNESFELTADEPKALITLLRQTLDYAAFPFAPRLDPLKANPGKARPAKTKGTAAATAARLESQSRATPPPAMRSGPMTLADITSEGVRLVVICLVCRHQAERDLAEMAQRYGSETTVPDWHARLFCSQCGSRQVDIAVSEA